jgi:cysteine-rich repeat protein
LLATNFAAFTLLAASGLEARELPAELQRAALELKDAAGAQPAITFSALSGAARFLRMPRGYGVPTSRAAASTAAGRTAAFLHEFGPRLGLPAAASTVLLEQSGPDRVGMEHVRLEVTHRGVPIWGAQLTVHLRGGTVVAVHSRTGATPDVDVSPRIPALLALGVATRLVADRYEAPDAALSEPQLEIFDRSLIDGKPAKPRLTWLVEARAPVLWALVWVDAETAEPLFSLDQLPDALDRRVHENSSGSPGALLRSEGDPPTGNADVDRIYDYSGHAYAYYLTRHSRDSWDGAGAPMVAVAHYPALNAFWVGSYILVGSAIVADDIIAHEWTHGVTQTTSGLIYFKESGAMNESYSDIFGETVDLGNGAGNDAAQARWALFEDLIGTNGVRHMYHPHNGILQPGPEHMSDVPFFACDPDDGFGVHTNSSLGNHAFALITDGGVHRGHTIIGIGLEKAAAIEYRALTVYLTPSSTYADNYEALLQSCDDLIGTLGITAADCTRVETALDSVEMFFPWPCDCGDGVPDAGEECDDGNVIDGDGCDSNCLLTGCGNGIVTSGEACDGGDCCTASCQIEAPGTICADDGSPCSVHQCDAGATCQRIELSGSCDDGDPDTVDDTCSAGVCSGRAPRLDAFKCYQARDLGDPPFVATEVDLQDQFGVNDGEFQVREPKLLCNPTSADDGTIDRPAAHLVCYQVKGPRLDVVARPRIEIANFLGTGSLEIRKPSLLCVPSAKTIVP